MLAPGTRVISPNGNVGTVIGNMTSNGSIVAIRLDNGRQISGLTDKCLVIFDDVEGK